MAVTRVTTEEERRARQLRHYREVVLPMIEGTHRQFAAAVVPPEPTPLAEDDADAEDDAEDRP